MKILKRCLFILLILFASQAFCQESPLCLVLGFESVQLSDLEDRLLRENLMRELKTAGFRVVKVMEVESLILEGGIDIRKIKPPVMKTVMAGNEPDIVVNGRLFPVQNSVKEKKLKKGKLYCFEALVWFRKGDRFMRMKKKTAFCGSLLSFFSGISAGLAEKIKTAY